MKKDKSASTSEQRYLPTAKGGAAMKALNAVGVARDWWVVSTALLDVVLIVHCRRTGAMGVVRDPTSPEWGQAFYAPDSPYRWADHSRVEVLSER